MTNKTALQIYELLTVEHSFSPEASVGVISCYPVDPTDIDLFVENVVNGAGWKEKRPFTLTFEEFKSGGEASGFMAAAWLTNFMNTPPHRWDLQNRAKIEFDRLFRLLTAMEPGSWIAYPVWFLQKIAKR